MSGEGDDMEDEADEEEMDAEDDMEEATEIEAVEEVSADESDELELDLDESEDEAEADEDEKLEEYVTPASASTGDDGDKAASPVNANAKRPGDDSNAKPVGQSDGNTAGGKGDAPKDMSTKNVNVSGNSKAPAMSPKSASEGDGGANTKSVSS
jgi:hypothetical protein